MFDPADDFPRVTDGLVPVTVRRPDGSTVTRVAHALRQTVRVREAQRSQGRYTAADVAWNLPVSELPEPPRPGDVIVDEETRCWTVLETGQLAIHSRWRCVARNLAVAHGLNDSIDLEKAEHVKGEGGADEPVWRLWRAGLSARIQPATATVGSEHGRQTTAARYTVYVADPALPDETVRIRGPDGAVYAITGYRKAEAIDALMEIDAVRVD